MDSITQAVLGAACGEAVLGKKMGNRAILWGGIAGTIPDLDVVSRVFLDHEIYGLLYHRGLTHSIIFTILGSLLFAWIAHKDRRWMMMLFLTTLLVFFGGMAAQAMNPVLIGISVGLAAIMGWRARKMFGKNRKPLKEDGTTLKDWYIMFFLAILTHWFIDACTSYGTQIYEPFSSYRVSFNNISIVDPLYTLPLLFGIIITLFFKKIGWRRAINGLGLVLSTAYMAFTFYAKSQVNNVVVDNLKAQNIEYQELVTYPTIFNAILWHTTVVTDSAFYYGVYSIMDEEPKIDFVKLPKNHHLLDQYEDERLVEILKWFAQGYYNVEEKENGELQFNNLRFGLMGFGFMEMEDPYIFKFRLCMKDGKFEAWEYQPDIENIDFGQAFDLLWRRIWGEQFEVIEDLD
jgi:inner membrane protein